MFRVSISIFQDEDPRFLTFDGAIADACTRSATGSTFYVLDMATSRIRGMARKGVWYASCGVCDRKTGAGTPICRQCDGNGFIPG